MLNRYDSDRHRHGRCSTLRGVLAAAMASCVAIPAMAQTTVTFQEGVGGYADTLDIFIAIGTVGGTYDGGNANLDGADFGVHGGDVTIDGLHSEVLGTTDQTDLLLDFKNIFGVGAGQVPVGSRIIDATLTFRTSTDDFSQTGSPYGVSQLLVPYDDTTTWNSLTDGIRVSSGEANRPIDQGFRGPLTPGSVSRTIAQDTDATANVTSILQNWSSGETQNGFRVSAGTTDGWTIITSGGTVLTDRPELSITYDSTPIPVVETVVLQQGLDGYAGAEGLFIDVFATEETNTKAADFNFYRPSTSNDRDFLFKFNSIFVSEGGDVPDDATIVDAQLVLTTENLSLSARLCRKTSSLADR